jgi:hypothetical protein
MEIELRYDIYKIKNKRVKNFKDKFIFQQFSEDLQSQLE